MPSVMCILFALSLSLVCDAHESNLNVQFTSEPTQYDPLFLEDGVALRLAANTVGTLYEYDGRGVLTPALVLRTSVSRDEKRYSFKFKKGLKWSDGKAFHADQFILALRRLSEAPVKAALSILFPQVDLKKTRAVDSLTAEVFLLAKDAQFLNWLSLPPFAPIRPEMIEKLEKKPSPVMPTLAAYEVIDYKREDSLLLKKNSEYYARERVAIDQVKIRFIKDDAPLVTLMKSGAIDVLCRVPVLQLEQLRSVSTVVDVPVQAVTYLGFNTLKPPFDSVQNRRSFRDSLTGKKEALSEILKTGELAAETFLPRLMLPPGWVSGHEFLAPKSEEKLTFIAQSDVGLRNQNILEYVQSLVKAQLGWKMNLDMMEWKSHYAKLKSEPESVFRFGWQNPVSDEFLVYQVLHSQSVNNFTGWKSAEYDRWVDELRQEKTALKRANLVGKIEKLLWIEAPVLPLLHQVLRFAYSKRVNGFRANPFGVILFRELRLAQNIAPD
jgi:ABC-type oligopeptide transport system substrate-binding subunit